MLFRSRGGDYHIWALRPDGTGLRQLTDGPEGKFDPVWSPDGSRLAASYGRESGLAMGFLDLPAEGIDGVQEIPEFRKPSGAIDFFAESWSPDGRHLVGAVDAFGRDCGTSGRVRCGRTSGGTCAFCRRAAPGVGLAVS